MPPQEDMTSLGLKIREFRKMRKMTVRRLADESALSASMISQIENGKAAPAFSTMLRIATALGLSLADLLSDGEAAPLLKGSTQGRTDLHRMGGSIEKIFDYPSAFSACRSLRAGLSAW